jgi:branched-chain amino acid transport system substrate-binding protein
MNKSIFSRCALRFIMTVAVLMFAGCGGGGQSDDVSQPIPFDPVADQYDSNSINIGSISYGNTVRNGILLGVKHVNEAGGVLGKPLNIAAFVAADADESVKLAQALIDQGIQVINVSYSSRSKAVSELTIARKVVLISESATSTFFTDYADDDFYFRLAPSDVHQGRVLAEVALSQGATTAATVFNEGDAYGDTLTREFKTNFVAGGGVETDRLAIPFALENGFDQYLSQLADSQPDVIINTILNASIVANFVNESGAFNLNSLFIMPDASAGQVSFVNNVANFALVDGTLGTSPGFGLADNPQMMFFADSFEAQFGTPPEGFTVNGYDFVLITALAIERAGLVNNSNNPTGEMIRDSLRAVMNPPGLVVGPSNLAQGLELVRSSQDINYSGGYGAIDWDANGDIAGDITYDVLRVDGATGSWVTDSQQVIHVPLD